MTQMEAAPSPEAELTFETYMDSTEIALYVGCLREAYKTFRIGRRDELAYGLVPIMEFFINELQARGDEHLVEMPPNEQSQGRQINLAQ